MIRHCARLGLTLLMLLALAGDAAAQRKGFFIGGGIGPGLTTGDEGYGSQVGVATDFKIGGMIGKSLQLYYGNRVNFTGSDVFDLEAVGVGGLGITYQMASGFRINGLVGASTWMVFLDSETDSEVGFGVGAGIGYEFAKHWVVNLDGTWGRPGGDINLFTAALTIGILSF